MKTQTRLVLALAGAFLWVSCSETVKPLPGTLAIELGAAAAGDRAITLMLAGQQTGISVPQGSPYRVFTYPRTEDSALVLVVSPRSQGFAQGRLVILTVADTRQVAHYSAKALEVAGADYSLRDPSRYALTVVGP